MAYWKLALLIAGLAAAVKIWEWSATHRTLYTIALLGALIILLAIHRAETRRLQR